MIDMQDNRRFKLPWSGAERDLSGYFHAFYIYILLVHYFGRVQGRPEPEQKYAFERISHIIRGLLKAIPELEAADGFNLRGKDLFEKLRQEVYELEEKQQTT
jgi:hypothetical protein